MTDRIEIEAYRTDTRIKYLKIFVENFSLKSVDGWVSVYEYDKNDLIINMNRTYIPVEIWADWSRDDEYLVEYVLDLCGYERKRNVPIIF